MNRLIVITTSLFFITSPVWAEDEAGDTHSSHDVTFGQSLESTMGKSGNCRHIHSHIHSHGVFEDDSFGPDPE